MLRILYLPHLVNSSNRVCLLKSSLHLFAFFYEKGKPDMFFPCFYLCVFNLENCFKCYIFSLSFALPEVSVKPETTALLGFRSGFPPAKSTSFECRVRCSEKGGLYIPVYLSHYLAIFCTDPLEQQCFAEMLPMQFYCQGLKNWTFFCYYLTK